jgi:hypothetical protein
VLVVEEENNAGESGSSDKEEQKKGKRQSISAHLFHGSENSADSPKKPGLGDLENEFVGKVRGVVLTIVLS